MNGFIQMFTTKLKGLTEFSYSLKYISILGSCFFLCQRSSLGVCTIHEPRSSQHVSELMMDRIHSLSSYDFFDYKKPIFIRLICHFVVS